MAFFLSYYNNKILLTRTLPTSIKYNNDLECRLYLFLFPKRFHTDILLIQRKNYNLLAVKTVFVIRIPFIWLSTIPFNLSTNSTVVFTIREIHPQYIKIIRIVFFTVFSLRGMHRPRKIYRWYSYTHEAMILNPISMKFCQLKPITEKTSELRNN